MNLNKEIHMSIYNKYKVRLSQLDKGMKELYVGERLAIIDILNT